MNILKRETPVSHDRVLTTLNVLLTGLGLVMGLAMLFATGLYLGYVNGYETASDVAIEHARRVEPRLVVAPVPVEPLIVRVIPTPTRITDCAATERAYWACSKDVRCSTERFEAIADDLNFCQSPPRR